MFDRQTDGQTDRILIARPRLHSMQHSNKLDNSRLQTTDHSAFAEKVVRFEPMTFKIPKMHFLP